MSSKKNKSNTVTDTRQNSTNKFLSDTFKAIRIGVDHLDYQFFGLFDCFHEGIYIAWYSGASQFHTVLTEPDTTGKQLSEEMRSRIAFFLEECVLNKAVVYTRDHKGFRWLVTDPDNYCICCQATGFKETDFQTSP